MGESRDDIRRQHGEAADTALGEAWDSTSTEYVYQMELITRIGAWLLVLPSTKNGTEIGVQEWRNPIFLRYDINPPDLPDYCNECGVEFPICYSLNCKKGGLTTECYNKLRNGFSDLTSKAFTPPHVCDDSKIYTGRAVHGGKGKLKGSP